MQYWGLINIESKFIGGANLKTKMSNPTKQHYVPQRYLREFADHNIPSGEEPFIWIFDWSYT